MGLLTLLTYLAIEMHVADIFYWAQPSGSPFC